MNFSAIDTPAVLIDEVQALANIRAYQAYCNEHGFKLRPHIKTHKLPYFAQAQLAAGAIGITCQKISEAEVMAVGGIRDILLTYNIVGATKLQRLRDLAGRLDKLAVVADSEAVLQGLSAAFAEAERALDVMIECDTGGGRCGVQSPEQAVTLALIANKLPSLNFLGLMTYPGVNGMAQVQTFMSECKAQLMTQGLDCAVVSSGGSPDMWQAHLAPVVTEYRIGTYIYNDRSLVERGVCGWEDCALTVLATVVSTPTPQRAVIDAGSKILTSDLLGLEGHGHVLGRDDLTVSGLSEEHGVIHAKADQATDLQVGDRVRIVPNHCCVVSNMVDAVNVFDAQQGMRVEMVLARGCVV